jgi:hypothetical protein
LYGPSSHGVGSGFLDSADAKASQRKSTSQCRGVAREGAAMNLPRDARRNPSVPQAARTARSHRTGADGMRSLSARDRQGEVHFLLQRVAGGVYVEREAMPRRGLHTVQSILFDDPDSFMRWCDSDPVRFEHPVLHTNLKRYASELLRHPA